MLAELVDRRHRFLEVGCGTGHWLARVEARGCRTVVGVDRSMGMLRWALPRVEHARLVRGVAEALPLATGSLDRIAVVNALHHFEDPQTFVEEARRALRVEGRVVVMGLDPSRDSDEWYVYDYFPRSLELDEARYPSTARITRWLEEAGFVECSSRVAHRIRAEASARASIERGSLAKHSTSQSFLLGEEDYAAGMAKLRAAVAAAASRGEEVKLRADLRIWATFGRVPA